MGFLKYTTLPLFLFTIFMMNTTPCVAGTVTNKDSGATYSDLQQAINHASSGDTLLLKGTFVGNFTNDGTSLTLEGCHKDATLDGNYVVGFSVFEVVGDNVTVILKDLEIKHGEGGNVTTIGGGITNNATNTLILENVKIKHNAARSGGGIYNAGILIMSDSKVEENSATQNGGGLFSFAGQQFITDTEIEDNTAAASGGGICAVIVGADTSYTTLDHSKVENNHASVFTGGGIFNGRLCPLELKNSRVHKNTSGTDGGGIFNSGIASFFCSEITENHANEANTTGIGGGIYNAFLQGGIVRLIDSELEDNNPDQLNGR